MVEKWWWVVATTISKKVEFIVEFVWAMIRHGSIQCSVLGLSSMLSWLKKVDEETAILFYAALLSSCMRFLVWTNISACITFTILVYYYHHIFTPWSRHVALTASFLVCFLWLFSKYKGSMNKNRPRANTTTDKPTAHETVSTNSHFHLFPFSRLCRATRSVCETFSEERSEPHTVFSHRSPHQVEILHERLESLQLFPLFHLFLADSFLPSLSAILSFNQTVKK